MNYNAAEHYLLNQLPMFQRIGAAAYRADLGNITALCDFLGNPQQYLRIVHIAGTNGKGSVTHLIAAALQEQGYRVGVFASPHYKTYRERIKINGVYIPKRTVSAFVSKYQQDFAKLNASFFEITAAMAFWYFHRSKTDFVILETGMGGRLDSTNIVTPLLSVVTNISFDHQQFLGNTLPLIAAEKAGIMKPGIPVIIGETQKETTTVFKQKSKVLNGRKAASLLHFADQEQQISNYRFNLTGSSFRWNDMRFTTDLSGPYQKQNFTTALCALVQLRKLGISLTDRNIRNAWKNVSEKTAFMGRWMHLSREPMVIADSAHNQGGLRQLTEGLRSLHYKKLHFVYGTVSDKDLSAIFPLLPENAQYYFCKPDIPRGKDALELQREAQQAGRSGKVFPSVKRAFQAALKAAAKGDLVLVSGSIFVVAEVL
ncbi:MAG: Mur ligase family protein [Chitinophagales bacterium]